MCYHYKGQWQRASFSDNHFETWENKDLYITITFSKLANLLNNYRPQQIFCLVEYVGLCLTRGSGSKILHRIPRQIMEDPIL